MIDLRKGFEGIDITEKNNLRRPLKIKFGVDPTAKEITFGWYVLLNELARAQRRSHEVVLVIGDFTAQIGDPTGKSKTRKLLTEEEVEANIQNLLPQFWKILDEKRTVVLRNSDWLKKMTVSNFMQVASKVTVSNILSRQDFSNRLENNEALGMHEIMYPLCQAWDSVVINPDVEFGGIDQKFNILLGRDLMKAYHLKPQAAFFAPLLIGTDGKNKMSQSLGNFISIRENPFDMFGKIMSIPDSLVDSWFELLVPFNTVCIEDIYARKRYLAVNIVRNFYDSTIGKECEENWKKTVAGKEIPENIEEVQIPIDKMLISLPELIVSLNLATSNSKAKNLIDQGGVSLDSKKLEASKYSFTKSELLGKVLKVGKREFRKLVGSE